MSRTHVILDGLQDTSLAQQLSQRWANAGLGNIVDVAGQCGTLWSTTNDQQPLTETDVQQAASIARMYGIELRDRVGNTFKPDNDPILLHEQTTHEYRSRLATALVFGLPALLVHYGGHLLATGGGQTASSMALPWLIQLLLIGWVIFAAGFPVIWQAGLSLRYLRSSPDLFTAVVIVAAYIPSAVGVLSLLWRDQPWFGPPGWTTGPAFHVAAYALIASLLQRYLLHRFARRLSGRAMLMIPRFNGIVGVWLALTIMAMLMTGWRGGLAIALVLPPLLAGGAINRWSPGSSMLMPVAGFTLVLLLSPNIMGERAHEVFIEAAFAFNVIVSLVFALGWRGFKQDHREA